MAKMNIKCKKCVTLVTLILVLLIFLPVPQRINDSYKDVPTDRSDSFWINGEVFPDSPREDFQVEGWRLRFLVFRDRYAIKLRCHDGQEYKSGFFGKIPITYENGISVFDLHKNNLQYVPYACIVWKDEISNPIGVFVYQEQPTP